MLKSNKLLLIESAIISFLLLSSCKTHYDLKNTEWLTVKFSIDSTNYLSEFEKKIYSSFNKSTKLHAKFSDTLVLHFVEGSPIDTSIYKIKEDTLYFIQGQLRDTTIILKLTEDSLIIRRLAGVTTYSVRIRKK